MALRSSALGGNFQVSGAVDTVTSSSAATGETLSSGNTGYTPPDSLTAIGTVITDPIDAAKLIAGSYTGNAGLAASGASGLIAAIAPVAAAVLGNGSSPLAPMFEGMSDPNAPGGSKNVSLIPTAVNTSYSPTVAPIQSPKKIESDSVQSSTVAKHSSNPKTKLFFGGSLYAVIRDYIVVLSKRKATK